MNDLPTEQSAEGASVIAVNSQGEAVKIPSSAVGGGGSSVAVVDNLNSNSSTSALSARQGKALNTRVTALEEGGGGGGGSSVTVVDNLNSDSSTSALSAKQGKVLDTKIAGKANTSHTHTAGDVSGLATVATSGSYDDLDDKPSIPTVSNATITIKQQGVTKGSFSLNQASDDEIDVGLGEETVFTAEFLKKVLTCRMNKEVYLTSGSVVAPNMVKYNGLPEPGASSTAWCGAGVEPTASERTRIIIHNVNVDAWKGRKFTFTIAEGYEFAVASGTVTQSGAWTNSYPQTSDIPWNWHGHNDPVTITLGDMIAIMIRNTSNSAINWNYFYGAMWDLLTIEETQDSVKNRPRQLKDDRFVGYRVGVLGDSILAGASTRAYKTALDVLVSDYGIVPVPRCIAGSCIAPTSSSYPRDDIRFKNRIETNWQFTTQGYNGAENGVNRPSDPFLGVLIFGVNDVLMDKVALDAEPFVRVLTEHYNGQTQLESTYDVQINTTELDAAGYLSSLIELESLVKSGAGTPLSHFYLVGPYMCTWPGNYPMNTMSKNPNGDTGEDFVRLQRQFCMVKGWSYMDILSSQLNTFLPGMSNDSLHPSQEGHQVLGDLLGQMLCGTILTQSAPIFYAKKTIEVDGENVNILAEI